MQKKILLVTVAFILYIAGVLRIVHWLIYWEEHEAVRQKNYFEFIAGYREKISTYIPGSKNFTQFPELISIVFFSVSGYIFLKQKTLLFRILAISAFILAFWNLFSLM